MLDCPNHTGQRILLRFTDEQLATPYPLFKTAKMRENAPWDHEGGYDERPFEPETDEEA